MLTGMNLGESSDRKADKSLEREPWDAPQLIPLDLGSAQAKYCQFVGESSPDNGPRPTMCS